MSETEIPEINKIKFEVGSRYKFLYGSNTNSSDRDESDMLTVRLRPELLAKKIAEITTAWPAKKDRIEESIEKFSILWTARREASRVIDDVAAIKKDSKIRLWEQFGAQHPEQYAAKVDAEQTIESVKRQISESNAPVVDEITASKVSSNPMDAAASDFFRYYVVKEIDARNAYVVTAWYCGETLDVRTGSIKSLFLTEKARIRPAGFVDQWHVIVGPEDVDA